MIRNRPELAKKWSPQEVAERWWYLFPKRLDKSSKPKKPTDEELNMILFDPKTGGAHGRLELLRTRLSSISWFMRCLNEYIARIANLEDESTGRFWEGRFKSVELPDQAAVLACLAYIDLNPIHAGIGNTPEDTDYTSCQERIETKI